MAVAIAILPASASGQAETCETGVRIAFQGSVCARDPFNLSLNGAVGSGDGNCTSVSWSNSNKMSTKLRLNQTYTLSLDAESCATYVNFEVPDDYKIYIDDQETNTIRRPAGTTAAYSWRVVVRPKCSCSGSNSNGGAPGASNGPQLGSVIWDVGLGTLADGRSAEGISIREDALSSYIYTPAALVYSPPINTTEVDVVRNGDGSLRQVKAPQTLADVVVISSSEYDIRFYRPADVGAKSGGVYPITGQPFVTWKIKNTSDASATKLSINRIENGVTVVNEYAVDPSGNSWSLSRGGARVETKIFSYPNPNTRVETKIVKDNLGNISSKSARTYFTFPWGEELVKDVLDPDGAALTTSYVYYTNPTESRFQKIQSVTYADGSWISYDYDSAGNKSLELRPWLDESLSGATEANSRSTRYTYSTSDGIEVSLYPHNLASIEEKVLGVTVHKTTYSRSATTVNGEPAVSEVQTTYSSANTTLQSSTVLYHASASAFVAGRTVSQSTAAGQRDSYVYEKGVYSTNADPSLNQFTPDVNGTAVRVTTTHGTDAAPNGMALKTTKETSITDQTGREVLRESYVYTGSAYERIAWSVMTYDDRGHLTQTTSNNGTITGATWDGDKQLSSTDANGIETDFTYDSLLRVKTKTKKGVAANGTFPAQADIVTTLNYDADGRATSQTVASGSLSLSSSNTYDLAGRTRRVTDQAGLTTSYAFSNSGRTTNTTLPGGANEVRDKYVDGQDKSITGSAAASRYFSYSANADGTYLVQEFIGAAGLNSARWTKTTTNWAGETIKVERPNFTGGTTIQTSAYNNQGQLQSETTLNGSNKVIADRLHEYDELGNETRSGLDVDASGGLSPASTDRIADTSVTFEKTGSDWFGVTTTTSYLTDNSTTPTIQTQRNRLTNFAVNGAEQTVSDSTVIDIAGNSTRTTTSINRAAKKSTITVDTPDSTVDAVTITVNGLLQSSAPNTSETATTYSYDALGRRSGVTSPRNGTSTSSYSATTGQLISTGDGVQTTTYGYYSPTETNAGRLKSQTNVNGKKVYFNYDSRGQLIQTWGDTTYPLEYVYDSYSQKTELHTFRGGAGWAGSAWPTATAGTADITRWFYHDATGLLTQKQDAATKQTSYTYDALGRIALRTWSRLVSGNALTTTYSYDSNTGELRGLDYSDTTPDVSFTYDRGGRQSAITDLAGTRTRTFNAGGGLQTEQVAGGLLDAVQVTVGYDSFLRRNSLQASYSANVLVNQTYGYDTSSRLQTVTSGSQTATFAYYPTSGLLNTTSFTGGTNLARSYDTLGRMQSISTSNPASGTIASYAYTYNNLSQRTKVTREDGSYWSYGYNDRGELVFGKKYWSDASAVMGQQTEYSFDNIGNRYSTNAGGNETGSLRPATYTANSLNQYTQRTVPGATDVFGTADPSAKVTVNDLATTRKADYFYREISVNNAGAPVYTQVNVVGAKNNYGAGGEDAVSQQGGRIYVPQATESYSYDSDGNLTADGRWIYTWDAENRLTSMEAIAAGPVEAKRRLEFAYDYIGRRIQKKVYGWNIPTSSYQLQTTTKFVYDGWSLIVEIDGSNALVRGYIRAGGELLLINSGGNTYQVGYDGNENVGALVKSSDGSVAALYDYDPFGQTMKIIGPYAGSNPFRFSGQYTDAETALIYYGFRYYNPQTARWISKDPSEEAGGTNLYAFLDNNALDAVDHLGLWKRDSWSGGWFSYFGHATAEKCDKLSDLAKLITGVEDDWKLLGHGEKLQDGEVIDIAPLLRTMESRLRTSVRRTTVDFNPAGFPSGGNGTPWTVSGGSQAAEVAKFFNRQTPYGLVGCDDASNIILTQGLIKVIGPSLYDEVLSRFATAEGTDVLGIMKTRKGRIGSMLEGDSAWLPNYDDYQGLPNGGDYGHENSIKIARDLFYGHPLRRFNIQQLERILQQAYVDAGGRRRSDPIPGLHNREDVDITFIDVAKVFGAIFDIRHDESR